MLRTMRKRLVRIEKDVSGVIDGIDRFSEKDEVEKAKALKRMEELEMLLLRKTEGGSA